MYRHIALLVVLGLGLTSIGKVRADVRPFPPKKEVKKELPRPQSVAVKIEVDDKAKEPRILMPRGFVAGNVAPGRGEVEGDQGEPVADNQRMLFTGAALSLSCVFGGLWLVRKKGVSAARGLSLALAVGGLLAAGTMVWGNKAAPERPPVPIVPAAALPTAWEGTAKIELQGVGEPVRIILDKESYEKLKKGELKAVPVPAERAPGAAPR